MSGSFIQRFSNPFSISKRPKIEENIEENIEDDQPPSKRPRADGPTPFPEVISLLSSDEEDETSTNQENSKRPQELRQPETQVHNNEDTGRIEDVYVVGRVITPSQTPFREREEDSVTLAEEGTDQRPGEDYIPLNSTPKSDHPTEEVLPSKDTGQLPTQIGISACVNEPSHENQPVQPLPPIREPRLCPEQAELMDIIMSGKNVFYTGSAGCGKSTILKAFTRRMRRDGLQVDIVAPTGISALGVGGSTTYTYAGWNISSFKEPLKNLRARAYAKFTRKRLKATDVLIIDEISMVSNFHFERLNAVMQEARTSKDPFGGVQLIVTGDFHQLPPVKPFETCLECGAATVENRSQETYACKKHGVYHDEDKWAFKSKTWEKCSFMYFHLKTIHRQNDEVFIKILQKCRIGDPLTGDETHLLINHPGSTGNATRLYASRHEVRQENQKRFNKLLSEKISYPCMDKFDPHSEEPRREYFSARDPDGALAHIGEHRFDKLTEFKVGMLVVLLVNLDLRMKLCNGSQGIVCGYEPFDIGKLPELTGEDADIRQMYVREFMERPEIKKKVWPIIKFHNGQVRTIYAECSIQTVGNEPPYSYLSRTQIPLAPAWAMSIHKSQSLTLDRVIVDLTRAWEAGQVYVALSRATSLEGLKIEGDPRGLAVGKGGNDDVRRFHHDKFGI